MFKFAADIEVWKAIIEMTMIAAAIYYLLVFLRGTRGAAVLTGLAALLISLTFVARLLELTTISWLLSWFFGFFAIALLVIFQPELRRLLAALGSRPFFVSTSREKEIIEIVSATAKSLSEKRIGALIAIEGTIGFRGIVERGVELDSKVSAETLTTIFFPNTPLHDGGVVIRGDRIAAAACIFPLSERPGLPQELGTRHRAALGLTEETDAVVIAVSEETGIISVAHRGILQRDLNRESLEQTLEGLLLRPRPGVSQADAIRRQLHRLENLGRESEKEESVDAPPAAEAQTPPTAPHTNEKTPAT